MPWLRKTDPEDAPVSGDPVQNLAEQADLRPHALTQELLDWLIAALETVLNTPQLRDMSERRVKQSLRDALKLADHLYPLTLRKEDDARSSAEAEELRAVSAAGDVPVGAAGRDGADGQGGDL